MLSVGIVGLPNVGKSTLFNALTAGTAQVSNYPFTTIDSNRGVVPVPDPRLEELGRLLEPEEAIPCFIEFIDIAGLVEGASRGEGLGNRFLGHIRQVDAVAHVLRCFPDPDIAHVLAGVDPVRDARIVEAELLLADLEVLEGAMEKRRRVWKTEPREHAEEEARWVAWREELARGAALRSLELGPGERRELKSLGLITGKPVLYVANVSEAEYGAEEPALMGDIRRALIGSPAARATADAVVVSAQIEWELQELGPDERRELLAELGLSATGLERLVERAFDLLGLIRFYTVAHGKLRAWEVARGTRAPQAAGEVHSDMEEGFIRARVASFEELREHGSLGALHERGRLRTEGRDYEVRDGDVIEFLFST